MFFQHFAAPPFLDSRTRRFLTHSRIKTIRFLVRTSIIGFVKGIGYIHLMYYVRVIASGVDTSGVMDSPVDVRPVGSAVVIGSAGNRKFPVVAVDPRFRVMTRTVVALYLN